MRLDLKEVFDCGNGRNAHIYQRMVKVCGYHCLGEIAVNHCCKNFLGRTTNIIGSTMPD